MQFKSLIMSLSRWYTMVIQSHAIYIRCFLEKFRHSNKLYAKLRLELNTCSLEERSVIQKVQTFYPTFSFLSLKKYRVGTHHTLFSLS